MLRIVLGVVTFAVGAYLLNDAKSDNKRARREYNDTVKKSKKKVEKASSHARKKDALDKLFKIKKAKRKVADTIYVELQDTRKELDMLNSNLQKYKYTLDQLFHQKKAVYERDIKRQLQEEINKIVKVRKELFATKDEMVLHQRELKARLKVANQETRMVQNEIDRVLG